ncbi:hypothetical protein IWQ61_000192 [Dispira simplex]|nr:hypothetical protein IWQ61_000192 [Dispira simplex]
MALLTAVSETPRPDTDWSPVLDKPDFVTPIVPPPPLVVSKSNSATEVPTYHVASPNVSHVSLSTRTPLSDSVTSRPVDTPPPPAPSINNSGSTTLACRAPTKRERIVQEILDTERTYVNGLRLVHDIFYTPLLEATEENGSMILPSKKVGEIFANFTDILNVNQEFLQQLEARLAPGTWCPATGCVGDIFQNVAPFFKMYSVYMRNFQRALVTIRNSAETYPAFRQFLRQVNSHEKLKCLTIDSYLMMPIQRLPRYRLLLADLVRHTTVDHPDYSLVTRALNVVHDVANFVNEMIRQHEMYSTMVSVQKSLHGFHENLIIPGRQLIKRGPVKKICRKNHQLRELFLFTDILLYASPAIMENTFNFHRKFPLVECRVIDLPDSPTSGVKNVFQIHNRDKSFGVYTDTARSKHEWVGALHQAINDHLSARRTLRVDRSRRAQSLFIPVPTTIVMASDSPTSLAGPTTMSLPDGPTEGDVLDQLPPPMQLTPMANQSPLSPRVVENYNAPVWVPDEQAVRCLICYEEFNLFRRKHHCRACGNVVCHYCSTKTIVIPGSWESEDKEARACDQCVAFLFGKEHLNDTKQRAFSPRTLLGSGTSSLLGRTRANRSHSTVAASQSLFGLIGSSAGTSTPDLSRTTGMATTNQPGTVPAKVSSVRNPPHVGVTSTELDRRRWSSSSSSSSVFSVAPTSPCRPRIIVGHPSTATTTTSASSSTLSSPTSPRRLMDYGLSTAQRLSLVNWTYGLPRSTFSSLSLSSIQDESVSSNDTVRPNGDDRQSENSVVEGFIQLAMRPLRTRPTDESDASVPPAEPATMESVEETTSIQQEVRQESNSQTNQLSNADTIPNTDGNGTKLEGEMEPSNSNGSIASPSPTSTVNGAATLIDADNASSTTIPITRCSTAPTPNATRLSGTESSNHDHIVVHSTRGLARKPSDTKIASSQCRLCRMEFTVFRWRNVCSQCQGSVCSTCLTKRRSQRQLFPITPSTQKVETHLQPTPAPINEMSGFPSTDSQVLSPKSSMMTAKISSPLLGVTTHAQVGQRSKRNLLSTWVQASDPELHPGEEGINALGEGTTVKKTSGQQTEKPEIMTISSPPRFVHSSKSSVPHETPGVPRRSSRSQLALVMSPTWRTKSEPDPTTVPLVTQPPNSKTVSPVAFPHRQISPRCPPRSLLAASHRHSCPPITSSVRLTTTQTSQVENRANRSLHQLIHLNNAASHSGGGHSGATLASSSWVNTSPTPSGKLCDVCALGLDPDRVVVNEDGSGWFYQIPE